jgi:hypothetical protein
MISYSTILYIGRVDMSFRKRNYSVVLLFILGLFASFSSIAVASDAEKPIVVINTFDVQGNAEGFMALIDKAIESARKLNPKGQGKTRILSGNIDGQYSNLITVATTYPNMDAYSEAYQNYDKSPELEAMRVKMDEAGYKVVHRSINTVVAEY